MPQEIAEILEEFNRIMDELSTRMQAIWEAIVEIIATKAEIIARSLVFIVSTIYQARKDRYLLSLDRRGKLKKTKYYYDW